MEIPFHLAQPSLKFSDMVSLLALATSVLALGWNIVRDLIKDRTAVDFFVAFGEIGNIKNSTTEIFADAGSLKPEHKFDEPGMIVRIVNTGRKPICIEGIGGEYTDGNHISMVVAGLPKMLQPYEIFSSTSKASLQFIQKVEQNGVKNLWASDTTGKTWSLSARGWERLRRTANYIATNKHL